MKIRTKSKNKDQIRTSFSILVLIRTFDYNKDQCGNTATAFGGIGTIGML